MPDGFSLEIISENKSLSVKTPYQPFPPARYVLQRLEQKTHDWKTELFFHSPGDAWKHAGRIMGIRLLDLSDREIIYPELPSKDESGAVKPKGKARSSRSSLYIRKPQ